MSGRRDQQLHFRVSKPELDRIHVKMAELGIQAGPEAASVRSVMVSATARPPKQAGPKVADDGTAASQLAEFLAAHRLI